ncbi:MAG: CBS domain-containing protein [Anaerolineae bacterium]|nr:CBS domain-containing protein [Anaerolineae bacterium]
MTRNPVTVGRTNCIRKAITLMRDGGFRRLPVVENGRLIGIVTDRDLRRASNSPLVVRERWYDNFLMDHIQVGACMTANPITVSPQTLIIQAACLLRDHKIGGLPVVEGERLVGIVTETDLLNYLIGLLEGKRSLPPIAQNEPAV